MDFVHFLVQVRMAEQERSDGSHLNIDLWRISVVNEATAS
jgi:hypothetical protein